MDLFPTGRKALAPIRCQDLHSACSLEVETQALAVSLPSHVQSKVITLNQPAPEHDPATFVSLSLAPITDTTGPGTISIEENFQKMLPILEKDPVAKNDAPQCQALLCDVGIDLRGEKPELEAKLKLARSELEKCQIELKSLREEEEEEVVAWLGFGSEERLKAAITAFKVERHKMIRDKFAQDSEIKSFHSDLKKFKSQVESYKRQLEAANLEKKAAVHNEGSYSRPSNHAQFDSISLQPITTGINFAAPAPPRSPATGITLGLGPSGRKALAPIIRCQDFHSACRLESENGDLAHVQSKVITHNQPAPEHDPPTGSDGGGRRHASQEQARHLREGPDRVWQRADSQRDTMTPPVGSSETNKELTFEQVSRHFSMPIHQAAREMNVGVTVLKTQCRKLGITRWPHRKVKSLQRLIDNVQVSASSLQSLSTDDKRGVRVLQELGKENAQENGHLRRSLVGFRQVCFNENNVQEDGHLTRSMVEFLQLTKKKMIEENPDMILDQRTNQLRQMCLKECSKRKRS